MSEIGAIDINSFNLYGKTFFNNGDALQTFSGFHAIVVPQRSSRCTGATFAKYVRTTISSTERRIGGIALQSGAFDSARDIGGSICGKVTVDWGGTEGTKVSFGGKGEIRDENGNYVRVEFEQNDDGKGSMKGEIGREND